MTERGEDAGVVRTRWTKARAVEVLRAAERSGQNLAEYCRERGLKYERVRRWKMRLAEQPALPKRSGFLPVQVVERAVQPERKHAQSPVPGVVELCIGEYVIRTRGDVSEAALVSALRAAKEAARC